MSLFATVMELVYAGVTKEVFGYGAHRIILTIGGLFYDLQDAGSAYLHAPINNYNYDPYVYS